jgi:hypothetical protein
MDGFLLSIFTELQAILVFYMFSQPLHATAALKLAMNFSVEIFTHLP